MTRANPCPPAAAAAWATITPALAGTRTIRLSRDNGVTYDRTYEGTLAPTPPPVPATIDIYDPDRGVGRLIVADFDVKAAAAAGAVEPVAAVAEQARELAELIARCGGATIADISPNGGRHVYILLAESLPWEELRDLAKALARRFPAYDPKPHSNSRGQIRPPGARHSSGGWQTLTTPLAAAQQIAMRPCGPDVWRALLAELQDEFTFLAPAGALPDIPLGVPVDDSGEPWIPRRGGPLPLRPDLAQVARDGIAGTKYTDRSRARMDVLGSAVMRGWRLQDVRTAIATGAWRGFARLYPRDREPDRLIRLLPIEWRRAIATFSGLNGAHICNTSDAIDARHPTPRLPERDDPIARNYGQIRMWVTAADIAIHDPDRRRAWGRQTLAIRQVLAALGQAAMVSGSPVVEFGCRNLALHTAVSYTTAARTLQLLRDDADPLIDLVTSGRLKRADRYHLIVPSEFAERARWLRRRAGRIDAVHPVFGVLGTAAAFTCQALSAHPLPSAAVADAAQLHPNTVRAALRVLGEFGLAERTRAGWYRGPVALDDAAAACGAEQLLQERRDAYRAHREDWHSHLARYDPFARQRFYQDPEPPFPFELVFADRLSA